MLPSERLAIAAHLHVLLRRKTGRVTDTEWMAQNAEYAAEIVRFCRARAAEDGLAELADWATKLEHAVLPAGEPSHGALAQAWHALRERSQPAPPVPARTASTRAHAAAPAAPPAEPPDTGVAPRYVGGSR